MLEKDSRRLLLWLLVFLYFGFLYNYGAKLSNMLYTDFPSFYYGAKITFTEKRSPYHKGVIQHAADVTEPPKAFEPPRRAYPYLYPPPSLLLFYPLAKLHVVAAKAALLAVNHLALLAVIAMVMLPICGFKPRDLLDVLPVFLIIYLFLSKGTVNTIELGQVNLIVLALLCLAWWGMARNWPAWAIAVPLAIASVFKVYPILFLALLAIRRRYMAAVLTVVVLGLICGASWLVLPRTLWHDWTRRAAQNGYLQPSTHPSAVAHPGSVIAVSRTPDPGLPPSAIKIAGKPASSPAEQELEVPPPTLNTNIGIAGFMARLFLPPRLQISDTNVGPPLIGHEKIGPLLTYAIVALLVLVTMGVSWLSTRTAPSALEQSNDLLNLQFSAFLVLTFLVAPLAWEHHLAYVGPAVAIAILAVYRGRPRGEQSWTPTLILLLACLIGWPFSIGKLPLPRVVLIPLVSVKLYAVLGLWGFLLREMMVGRRGISNKLINEALPRP